MSITFGKVTNKCLPLSYSYSPEIYLKDLCLQHVLKKAKPKNKNPATIKLLATRNRLTTRRLIYCSQQVGERHIASQLKQRTPRK